MQKPIHPFLSINRPGAREVYSCEKRPNNWPHRLKGDHPHITKMHSCRVCGEAFPPKTAQTWPPLAQTPYSLILGIWYENITQIRSLNPFYGHVSPQLYYFCITLAYFFSAERLKMSHALSVSCGFPAKNRPNVTSLDIIYNGYINIEARQISVENFFRHDQCILISWILSVGEYYYYIASIGLYELPYGITCIHF